MSVKQTAAYIGQTASWNAGYAACPDVLILDVRELWGRIDCLIRPVAGEGKCWVSIDKLIVREGEAANA